MPKPSAYTTVILPHPLGCVGPCQMMTSRAIMRLVKVDRDRVELDVWPVCQEYLSKHWRPGLGFPPEKPYLMELPAAIGLEIAQKYLEMLRGGVE